MPPYQPAAAPQPLYAPAPMQPFPTAPPPPPPVYRQPVTLKRTKKTIVVVASFMIIGTAAMLGLSALASMAVQYFTYGSLQNYTAPTYSISIPTGWQAIDHQTTGSQVHYIFSDSQSTDTPVAERNANLDLLITTAVPFGSNMTFSETSLQNMALKQLQQQTKNYQKQLACQNLQSQIAPIVSTDQGASHFDELDTCMVNGQQLYIYDQYVIDPTLHITTEVLQVTPDVWQQHQDILLKSLNSVVPE